MDSTKKYDKPSPESSANFISKIFFCWILPFIFYGFKHDIESKDIYNAGKPDQSGPLGDALEANWEKELENAKNSARKPKLINAIKKTFFWSYSIFGVATFIHSIVFRMILPIALAEYIKYFDSNKTSDIGWYLGASVVALSFLNVVFMHQTSLGCQRIGMRCRIACCSLMYRKLLKLNRTALGTTQTGQLVNLMSNDVQRFDLASNFLHYIWIMPIQTVIAAYIMFSSVGWAAFAGLAAIILQAVPLQGYLGKLQGVYRGKIAGKTDQRVKLMNEITSGMQVIKMYAWEKPFEKMVALSRKHEVRILTKTSYIRAFSTALSVFTERATLYLILIVFVLMGQQLTASVAFSMAQILNTVQLYMAIFFPMAVASLAEAKVSIKRLEEFLVKPEMLKSHEENITDKNGKIKIEGATASWVPNQIVDTLMDVNLDIKPGTLCCVVGSVGAGKSSLLQLLLRELPLLKGSLEIVGQVTYASQEPWLFVSNVRNNILFGQPFLKNRYRDVVKVCALERDFELFPYGDKTLVGERGVSLSGGQRARLNLARAVYREADIYLFDDPLSAVDTHVAKHLFNECLMKYLRGKTRILVTHQLQFLKQADLIVVLNNGKIEKIGTFNELNENDLNELSPSEPPTPSEDKERSPLEESIQRERLTSISSTISSIQNETELEPQETEEAIERGSIPTSTYREYFRSGANYFLLFLLFVLLIIAQMASNACDLWSKHWVKIEGLRINLNQTSSDVSEESILHPQEYYMYIYTLFILGSIILTTLRSMWFFKICMNASIGMHNKMFSNILQAPMRFYDTNPSGRILSRFSKDMGAIDEIIPQAMLSTIQIFMVMSGILAMVFIVIPFMIIPAVILGTLFVFCRVLYLGTAQNVKRLEGTTRAPVFSHVSASLNGLPTIRASHAQEMITKEFDGLQDQHTGAWFMFIASSETFGFYLDVISTVFLAIVSLQFMIYNKDQVFSGDVGLVISQSLILTGMLQYGVRQSAEVASNMTSVERVLQYTKIEKEGPFETLPANKPTKTWPSHGKIVFKNTYLRYVPEEEPVLKNLNIEILPTEKIGIVGRTGAGKSTMIASLFHLAKLEGTIEVDEIDTKTLGLHDLRSNISIIPQEPVLFSATVRYNLDPFEKSSDEDLWKALENVELKQAIEDLNQSVSEGGSNFSAGQRQLVCLARAIVRNNKILVMDEATANVDPHTDALIQSTIRNKFKDCTVLTIAHRLNTIMDSDKVVVMEAGQAVEFDHPYLLLQNPEGFFSKMVEQTGPTLKATLKQVAEEDYKSKFPEPTESNTEQ